ncbi:hypothetical protein NKH77_32575 [Streptomyces sp. M19]
MWTDDAIGFTGEDGTLTVVAVDGDGALTYWNEVAGARALPRSARCPPPPSPRPPSPPRPAPTAGACW